MGLFRNPEIKRAILISAALTAVFSAVAFSFEKTAGLLVLILGVLLILVDVLLSRRRYGKIRRLSETVDRILHENEVIVLDDNKEGELAILESELHKMTIKLREQASDLLKGKEYLTDSIADISHQIRTPLTTVNILLSFLQEENLSDERRKRYLKSINQNLARIDWLISALLKISKIDAGTAEFKREKVSVMELVDKAVEPLLIPMELREQVFDFCSGGTESFLGDINWTQEAVENIIKNCMEHTPPGGHINVKAAENSLYTEIIIQDNGPGINEEDLSHIFERFYKGVGSNKAGVGIGLAMARMIIQEQNGTIKAENRISGGASFRICFYKGERYLKQ